MRSNRQYVPVRIDDHAGHPASLIQTVESQEFDARLMAGILFWMTLIALAVISFAL